MNVIRRKKNIKKKKKVKRHFLKVNTIKSRKQDNDYKIRF